jgi:hypothetical protein
MVNYLTAEEVSHADVFVSIDGAGNLRVERVMSDRRMNYRSSRRPKPSIMRRGLRQLGLSMTARP